MVNLIKGIRDLVKLGERDAVNVFHAFAGKEAVLLAGAFKKDIDFVVCERDFFAHGRRLDGFCVD